MPEDARHGADVYDPAVSALDHVRCECLRNEERAAQVCVQHKIPVVPSHVYSRFANVLPDQKLSTHILQE
jgi:hypothetical protein